MGKRSGRRRAALPGPPLPNAAPPGQDGETCHIVYGHNAEIKRVLMQFSVGVSRLIFTPDEAEQAARNLLERAQLARGRVQ